MTAGRMHADDALLPNGWARQVLIEWDDSGTLTRVDANVQLANEPAAASIAIARGPLIPGMPNLHSHAFQRAFAGLTEHRSAAQDSFWSWRTLMYRFASRLDPQQMDAIATWLYAEMIEAGYTSVCEFQYLHHDIDGQPYADDAAMSLALLRAAQRTGIGMTLLPVLYQSSGFGGTAPGEGQRRFIRSTDSMLRLLQDLSPVSKSQGARLGLAPHSLRAVPSESLRDAVAGLDALDASAPIHIHVAEQVKEVDDCMAWSGQRPVAWLLDHVKVDARWCLVHATHMDATEVAHAARSGAVAGLCPSTEANLGDGLFAFTPWLDNGGRWGIGSDSHACVNAAEELMLLEYGQRLSGRQRNVGVTPAQPHVATALTLSAVDGGAQAAARPINGLQVGQQADFVILDRNHLALQGLSALDMLSAHVFASHRTSAIDSVWIAGQARVQGGRHTLHDESAAAFAAARSRLLKE